MPVRLVAVLGTGVIDRAAPVVTADDAGLTRGDGCFEGCRLRTSSGGASAIDNLDKHLARMARSAEALGIAFDVDAWRRLVGQVAEAWTRPGEAALKLVLTREGTGFATVSDLPADYPRQRRDGITVITLSRGYAVDAFAKAPWLLGGVKTLSYGVNMAALREAEHRGADDAILLATDGTVLETPTGTVVWAVGRTLHTTPTGATGILGGTTVELLFERAGTAGWTVEHTLGTVADLHSADSVWVVSSVRGPVDVIAIDGTPRDRNQAVDAEVKKLAGF